MIEELADGLKNLEKFVWGGVELPPDTLWITLRRAYVNALHTQYVP
jgi:hypothetical protein